jgi:single-strand DNA-binding protein
MNICNFTGRLGKPPETRYTNSGMAITTFSMAISDGYGDKKKTYWPNFVCFDKTDELVANSLDKGSKVLVEARYTEDQWEDKDGNKRMAVKMLVNRVEFLDSKKKESEPSTSNSFDAKSFGKEVFPEEEIPF